MEQTPGDLITARYRLEDKLGSGGFGDVWLARDLESGRNVAVKFLKHADHEARQRFNLEAEALARLDHPHCVRILDFGGINQRAPYLVTEYVRGPTLDEWLMRRPAGDAVLKVASQIAHALAHAHSRNITHRDIKPANIVIAEAATGPKAMLLDFGVSKLAGVKHADITKTGVVLGTPGYMSPEQLRAGAIAAPTDIYAFGVLLFEMFEGRPPFVAPTMLELAMAHVFEPVPTLASAPSADIRDLVRSMLQKDAATRPSVVVVAAVLRGEPFTPPSAAGGEERRHPQPTPPRAYRRWILGSVAVALVVAAYVRMQADDAPVQPAVTRPPNPLVRTASTASAPARDAGASAAIVDAATRPDGGSTGCGRELGVGDHWLKRASGGDQVGVRVPPQYNAHQPAPILVMFHDVLQAPTDMLKIADLMALADRDGVVVIVPADDDVGSTWLTRRDFDEAAGAIHFVSESLCLDMRRIYVIGHGNGGYAATGLACALNGVVAIAQTSHRLGGDVSDMRCDGERPPAPTMLVSMRDDPANPIADVPDCLGRRRWSLPAHEDLLRNEHQCSSRYDPGGRSCQALKCQVPLTLCHPKGGRDWASMPSRFATDLPWCRSPAGEFNFAGEIWSFFQRAAPFGSMP